MSVPELKPDPVTGIIYMWWTEPTARGERGRSKRKSTGTRSMAEAKAFLGEWLLMERHAPATPGAVYKVADLWRVYWEKHVEPNVVASDTLKFSWNNLKVHFGNLTVAEIDDEAVAEYVKKRSDGRIGRKSVSGTVRRELGALVACLNWHADPKRRNRLIQPSDVPYIELPEDSEPRKRWLRAEEMARLYEAAKTFRGADGRISRVERFLWLAAETAARKTAIYQLTWDRVSFELGMIDYEVPGRRRTKKRRAQVPISPSLMPVLKQAYAERQNEYVLDNTAEIWATVQSVARKAGFGPEQRVASGQKPKATGVSPHVLRHTAATCMLIRGVPPWTVAGILGNSEEMVRKVYGHLCNDAAKEAVAKISGVL